MQILCSSPCRITLNWSMIMVPEVIADVKNRSWGISTISYHATISRESVIGPSRKGDWLLQTGAEGLLKKQAWWDIWLHQNLSICLRPNLQDSTFSQTMLCLLHKRIFKIRNSVCISKIIYKIRYDMTCHNTATPIIRIWAWFSQNSAPRRKASH